MRRGEAAWGGAMSRARVVTFLLLFAGSLFGSPQHGTAESGYYPPNYAGDTFTGRMSAWDDVSRQITLTYTDPNRHKNQTFVGVLEADYTIRLKDGTERALIPSDIRPGALLKVYYRTAERKVEGKKEKVNSIFLIAGSPNLKEQYARFQAY